MSGSSGLGSAISNRIDVNTVLTFRHGFQAPWGKNIVIIVTMQPPLMETTAGVATVTEMFLPPSSIGEYSDRKEVALWRYTLCHTLWRNLGSDKFLGKI